MIYLTGAHSERTAAVADTEDIGLMAQPGNRYDRQLGRYRWWAADNGCFAKGEAFDADAWLEWLSRLGHRDTCLFAVAPDVVADAAATLERSRPWLPRVRALGYRVAYAAQDGATPVSLPWDEFDALFIGGTTKWKLSLDAAVVAHEGRRRGKHVHMGRVNSGLRMLEAQIMGCDSVDGTFLAFRARRSGGGQPNQGVPEIVAWLESLRRQPVLDLTWAVRLAG